MFFDYDKNRALTALSYTAASVHSSYPGSTGANEVAGGTYARQTPSVGAYSGGVRVVSSMTWNMPAGSQAAWIGLWNGVNFGCAVPNGAVPKEFVIDTSTSTVRSPAHGYANTQTIVFYADTVPTGLTAGTVYFVISATTDTFQVSATSGGSAITLSSQGGQGCQMSAIFVDLYASASTHTVTSITLGAPL